MERRYTNVITRVAARAGPHLTGAKQVVTSAVLRGMLHNPSPRELEDFLDEHLRSGDCLVQVVGECEVFYQGRAASVADAGDYVVMAKCDGSLQVHGHRGVKPVNWQPQSDDVRVVREDGFTVLYSERFTPAEMVRVAFLEPVLAQALALREANGFVLMGSESEMQDALARRPELIEEGLTLLDRELPTEVGGIDLYARDGDGNLVVVELKRGKAGQEAVHQLGRYVERVRSFTGLQVRGVLAAPAITAPALKQLQERGLEFREVTALPLEEDQEQQPSLFGLVPG